MMQYDNYDTDNTLRQMEDQSLPDLSKMNEHWEQMRSTLSAGVQPGNASRSFLRRPGFYALAAIFIGLIVLVVVLFNKTRTEVKQEIVTAPKHTPQVQQSRPFPVTNFDDTIQVADAQPQKYLFRIDTSVMYYPNPGPTYIFTHPKDFPPLVTTATPIPDYSAQLESFFGQLEKPAQEFVINTKKDTVIFGKDGSAFLIPANTFSMASVTILLKEFYSMKDIVANRLTTMAGDKQLITGGMVNITAVSAGQQVQMQPGKSIRWFIPDTSAEMKQMQLFNGVEQGSRVKTSQSQKLIQTNLITSYTPAYTPVNRTFTPHPTIANATLVRIDSAGTVREEVAYGIPSITLSTRTFDESTVRMDSLRSGSSITEGNFSDGINWIPQQRFFTPDFFTTRVRVLDLRDTPIRTVRSKKGVKAIFRMSDNSVLEKDELEKRLLEKYGRYYYEIKVVERAGLTRANKSNRGEVVADGVGDSIWIDLREAQRYRLPAADTATAGKVTTYAGDPNAKLKSAFVNSLSELANRYSVDIRTLGWVNIDKFYRYGLPQVPFKIDIQDRASNYYTLLVFDKIRSVMNGAIAGNEVLFNGVPEGMTAKVVVIGVKDGKTVMATKDVTLARTTVTDLVFEEVSADEYKEEIALLDK
jgi:hypothetical protein